MKIPYVTALALLGAAFANDPPTTGVPVAAMAETPDATSSPQRTLTVSVGGHKVHVVVQGKGGPVIVLEAGFASDSAEWVPVQPKLAAISTVVSYDRAGIGTSEEGRTPRTARQIASDLHEALHKAELEPPYVLVGHSAGGLYSRMFAYLYPEETAGLVLVEPAPTGFYRWFERDRPKAWDEMKAEAVASSIGAKEEMESLDVSLEQVRKAWPLPTVPVYLLVATRLQPPFKDADGLKLWISMQKRLCRKLAECTYAEDRNSGHYMPGDDPNLIVSSVRKVIARTVAVPCPAALPVRQSCDRGAASAPLIIPKGIQELHARDRAATLSGDPEKLKDLWTNDAWRAQPGSAPELGLAAIHDDDVKTARERPPGAAVTAYRAVIQGLEVHGDVAIERGYFEASYRRTLQSRPMTFRGALLRVLRKGADGRWHFSHVMWTPF